MNHPPLSMWVKSLARAKNRSTPLFGKNSLNFVKLLAALQVMAGHMTEHLKLPVSESAERYLHFFKGVPVFFGVSGFLIWFSVARSASCEQFLRKRFKRIYPELWAAVAVELLVLVSLYNGWNAKDLFIFALGQGSVFQFWTPDSLRGYGVGVPNGALWTICSTIQFYLVAWPFYRLMRGKSIKVWIFGFVIALGASIFFYWVFDNLIGVVTLTKLFKQTLVRHFWLFYIGAFAAEWYERIVPIFMKYYWALLLAAFFFFQTSIDIYAGYYVCWCLCLILGVIGFAYRFPRITIKTDISYGLFLYHMTVVNLFVSYGWTRQWNFAAAAFAISLLLALSSTLTMGRLSGRKP